MQRRKQKLAAAAVSALMTAACCALPAGVFAADEPGIGMSVLAGGAAIGMRVYIDLPDGETLSDCTVTFDGETPSLTETNQGYMFSVQEFAMHMTKEHTLVVKSNTGKYNKSETLSVQKYLNAVADDKDYGALAKSMLMYGGAAQQYFDEDADNPASAGITGADYSNVNVEASPVNKESLNSKLAELNAPVRYYGMNLSLQSETAFTLFFGLAEDAALNDAKDYLAGLNFGGESAAPGTNGTKFATVSVKVPATKLGESYTLGSLGSFSPEQYLAAAIASDNTKLANVCKALYAYGKAAADFKEPEASGGTLADDFAVRSGRATTYDYQVGAAHLDDYVKEHGLYVAALTDDDFDAYNGGMIEITYGSKTITALVADKMPLADNLGRRAGDVDLDPAAFKELTGNTTGDYGITWKLVPNSAAEGTNIQYHFEHGSSIYYMKIQPRNSVYPIAKFEYKVGGGDYIAPQMTSDACYVLDPSENSVLSFRITDVFGQVIEETNFNTTMTGTELTDDTTNLEGTVQFPK